jgi:double-stranded uracil-DNA glycosylase
MVWRQIDPMESHTGTTGSTDGGCRREVLSAYESDVLARGLDVVFCGLNPASSAAADGHNFSNRSNRFWSVVHLAGFTDVHLRPQDERRLLEYGCGITAVVARPTRRAEEISTVEFRDARPAFEAKMRMYSPRVLAFLGKRAFLAMIGRSDVGWGRYPQAFADCAVWILPNPSGLNRRFTVDALVEAYADLRNAVAHTDAGQRGADPDDTAADSANG